MLIETQENGPLRDPVFIAAFEGWNDAGEAATGASHHLANVWDAEEMATLDPEDYYDFQVTRPTVTGTGADRMINWPSTRFAVARGVLPERDVVLVRGPEPSFRWPSFVEDVVGFAEDCGASMFVTIGALLADTPHTRPTPVGVYAEDESLRRELGLEAPAYEGPTGITGIISSGAGDVGIPSVSVWASVPHYAASSPSPKAVLAIIARLESLLSVDIPRRDLIDLATAWEQGVDELMAADAEIAEYVQSLEKAKDTVDSPEASGEAIAREFERYLRGRDGEEM
ncbi:PAC2 family protein [Dermatophilus congolensis]|uniref:PAC2 family protein n=1 Tax=Dermatophilus congolensis TaxID=1863 RepID=UPI001AAF9C8A|nr:PAC2 family protein [Dermatophilus congolensis]MBO3142852.1 PAC2 family protein [Dermatophilus congolensis]MBO3151844.1 PAC2 family protein [Dermatophilus congolensis]MBO3161152.1 PAC2 family protein [Dermatophilus congolensis]MBO3163127.1 PAC2 family protein [Dermatophilus congolensis]MBO3176682.1 PAC2 family protein [Dermatophilus congolensis]